MISWLTQFGQGLLSWYGCHEVMGSIPAMCCLRLPRVAWVHRGWILPMDLMRLYSSCTGGALCLGILRRAGAHQCSHAQYRYDAHSNYHLLCWNRLDACAVFCVVYYRLAACPVFCIVYHLELLLVEESRYDIILSFYWLRRLDTYLTLCHAGDTCQKCYHGARVAYY